MPQKQAERMMALHHNCVGGMEQKRRDMQTLKVRPAAYGPVMCVVSGGSTLFFVWIALMQICRRGREIC